MSTESNESQPSIDDILSSIREIIADTGVEKAAPRIAENAKNHHEGGPNGQPNILSVLRGGQAHEPDPQPAAGNASEPAEEVLDLSEEFIVTDAEEAAPGAQEPFTQVEAEAHGTEAAFPEDTADEGATEDADRQATAETNVWAEDFQMPLGADGPTSPFTATQTHPESAWPASDPFDVTESYKLARSQTTNGRSANHDEQPPEAEPTEPMQEPAHQHAEPAADSEPGIELASLSESEVTAETAPAPEDDEPAPGSEPSMAPESEPEPSRAFPVADELEAVFGMPPRQWGRPAQIQDETPTPSEDGPAQPADRDAVDGESWGETEDAPSHMTDDEALTGPHAAPVEENPEGAFTNLEAAETQQVAEPAFTPPQPAPSAAPQATLGGKTLEDSVKELLRPMLQEWLDKNMPRLVEAAMREEVAAPHEQHREGDGAGPQDDER